MRNNRAEFRKNQLIINGQKSPLLIRATLIFIILICAVIPIIAIIALIAEEKGPHFGIFIIFIFFWGIGFYLLRIILWNTFGKEVLTFENDSLLYEADYRFFKDGKKFISNKFLEISIVPVVEKQISFGTFQFSDSEKSIETVLSLPLERMEELTIEIEKICQPQNLSPN